MISFWLNATFFSLSFLWDVLQVHTSPDIFALVASESFLSFSLMFIHVAELDFFYGFSTYEAGGKKPNVIFWLGGEHERHVGFT